jgi:hypothetical protein
LESTGFTTRRTGSDDYAIPPALFLQPPESVRVSLNHLLFLLMSLIWGVTWIATKAGIAVVPPIFFGAVRYALVSVVLVIAVRDLRNLF